MAAFLIGSLIGGALVTSILYLLGKFYEQGVADRLAGYKLNKKSLSKAHQ